MAALVDGTVYTVVGDQDYIDLQIVQADGVSPRDLAGNTNIKVRLLQIVDKTTIIFDIIGNSKVEVLDEANGQIRIKQAGDEYTQQAEYTYYIDVIDNIGSHAIPMKEELRQKWFVAPKIGA